MTEKEKNELYVKRDKAGGRNTIRFTNYNIDGDPFYEQVYELCKDCMEKVRDFVLSKEGENE